MSAELRHGARITREQAVELINERGLERIRLTPASVDLELRDRSTIAVYKDGPPEGRFRYEEWHK